MAENNIIIQIREAEKKADEEKNAAQVSARRQIAEAKERGEKLVEESALRASEIIKKAKTDGERNAAETLLTEKAKAIFAADTLKKSVKQNVDDAARLILRRIFDD